MTTLAQLHDCHSCHDERSIDQKKKCSKNQLLKVDHCDSVATVLRQWEMPCGTAAEGVRIRFDPCWKLCPAYVLHLAPFCSSVASSVKKFASMACHQGWLLMALH